MDYKLSGQVAIVTGAASGIGLETTKQLLNEGVKVVGVDLRLSPEVNELASGADLLLLERDLTDPATATNVTAVAQKEFGKLDILASCAGIAPVRSSVLEGTDDDWRATLDVNLMSLVRLSREVVPAMRANGGGAIVSIASDAGRMPDPFFVEYNVSKAAVLMYIKALSIEVGPQGIRANSVSPGPIRTPMWDRPGGFTDNLADAYGMGREEAVKHFATEVRRLPLERMGRAEEVAAAILFLVSPQASFVTGTDFAVNGGSIPLV